MADGAIAVDAVATTAARTTVITAARTETTTTILAGGAVDRTITARMTAVRMDAGAHAAAADLT